MMQINTRQAPLPLPPEPSPTADDSNVDTILSVSGLMMGLSFAIVGLRIWVRQFMIKTLGVDDMVMMAALVSALPAFFIKNLPHRLISKDHF